MTVAIGYSLTGWLLFAFVAGIVLSRVARMRVRS